MTARWTLRPSRGGWHPGRQNAALFTIQVALTYQAAARGIDYLLPDPDGASLLSRVEDSAPIHVWAAMFIASALLVVAGWATRWGQVIAAGHFLAMACYGAIGLGVLQVTGLGPGFRTPSGLLVTAVVHAALGFSIVATLRRREVSEHLDNDEAA